MPCELRQRNAANAADRALIGTPPSSKGRFSTMSIRHRCVTRALTVTAIAAALLGLPTGGCSSHSRDSGETDGEWDAVVENHGSSRDRRDAGDIDSSESNDASDIVRDGGKTDGTWDASLEDSSSSNAYDDAVDRDNSDAGGDASDGDSSSVVDEAGDSDSSNEEDASNIVEYRGCSEEGALSRVFIYHIDRTNSICAMVWIEENIGSCQPLGLVSEGWCLSRASVSSDITACEALRAPGDAVQAIAATGTFIIGSASAVDIDVEFEFPSQGTLPERVHVRAANCEAVCAHEDCRR